MDRDELRKKLRRQAQKKIEEKFSGKEVHISKAINLLDDLDSSYNLLNEALIDWKKKNPVEGANDAVTELEKSCEALKSERQNLQNFIEEEMNKDDKLSEADRETLDT